MLNANHSNFHVEYMDVTQHWNPNSESYAGGDCLVTALYDGWIVNPTVYVENKWYSGMRQAFIYHVELTRDGEKMTMPVVHNPYIARMLRQESFKVLPIEERQEA